MRVSHALAVAGSVGLTLVAAATASCSSSSAGSGPDGGYVPDVNVPDLGAPGDTGSADAPVDAGSSNDSGDAGDSGSSSDAGDSGGGNGTPPWPVSHTQWLDACYTLVACNLWPGQSNDLGDTTDCVFAEPQPGQAPPLDPSQVTCVLAAGTNCSTAAQCVSQGASGCGGDAGATCSGSVATSCPPLVDPFKVDCAAIGLSCVGGAGSGCGLGTCTTPGASSCVSGALGTCGTGGQLQLTRNCAAFSGGTCGTQDGGATCVGTGAACTADSCSGTVLNACLGGFVATYDCAQQGLTCVIDPSSNQGLCQLGTTCNATNSDGCVDLKTVGFCNLGTPLQTDCTSLGFSGCSLPGNAAAGACH